MTIGHMRAAFTAADHAAVPASNKAFHARAAAGFLREDEPPSRVDERIAPERGDIVVRKTRVGAFSTTDLPHLLPAAAGWEEIADYVLAWALRHARR